MIIRAPSFQHLGQDVEVLATLPSRSGTGDDQIVGVRPGTVLATAFHPELTKDDRFHAFFMDLVLTSSVEYPQSYSNKHVCMTFSKTLSAFHIFCLDRVSTVKFRTWTNLLSAKFYLITNAGITNVCGCICLEMK